MARQLVIELVGSATKLVKSLNDAETGTRSFGDKVESAGKKMTAFVSVPILGFLAASTKAAMDDAAAQAHLATTLGNTIGNSKALVTQVEDYITKAQKVSTFTDDELRPAFEKFATSTRNLEDSQRLMGVAMDVAAAKGIPLDQAATAVARAFEGQYGAANKLVPGLIDVKDASLTGEAAVAKLASTFNGQAIAATETTAGKMQNLKRDLGEASEAMGTKLMPAIAGFANFATGTLIPAIDNLSGGNGAFILMAAALAGPVLTAVTNVKNAVIALNGALTFLMEHPVILFLVSLALALKDIRDRLREVHQEGFTLAGLLKGIPGSGISIIGGALGHLGVPGFAAGGTITGPAIVGENGPELFIPRSAGTIVPNGAGAGGGTTLVIQAGAIVTENQLADLVQKALLRKQARTGSLGFA